MDYFRYNYKSGKNQLDHMKDWVTQETNADDLKTQAIGNYIYNSIGQLVKNVSEGIAYKYNASGLVTEVTKNNNPLVKFYYDDKGYKIKKEQYRNGYQGKYAEKDGETEDHVLKKHTRRALGLSKQQGKIAIEGLKKDIGLPPNFHGKIKGNVDLAHPNSRQVLGNLFDYLH